MAQDKAESAREPISYRFNQFQPDIIILIQQLERINTKIWRQKMSIVQPNIYNFWGGTYKISSKKTLSSIHDGNKNIHYHILYPLRQNSKRTLSNGSRVDFFSSTISDLIRPIGSIYPCLYGLPKTLSLRPILSMIGSSQHRIAKWLTTILQSCVGLRLY